MNPTQKNHCECWKHRYHVVHIHKGKIYDHSQGTWDSELRGINSNEIQNIPSELYQHGDTAEMLSQRYSAYLLGRKEDKAKISTSYGKIAEINGIKTPFIYSGGYGQDKDLTQLADEIAERLSNLFGLSLEKRGNSDGRSCGAHYDKLNAGFGLSARRRTEKGIIFHAYFEGPAKDAEKVEKVIPGSRRLDHPYFFASSDEFDTMDQAFDWLEKYGCQFCPSLQKQVKP